MSDITIIAIKLYESSDKIITVKENILEILKDWMCSSLVIYSNHTEIHLEVWDNKWREKINEYDKKLFKDFRRSSFAHSNNNLCEGWIDDSKNGNNVNFSGIYNVLEDNSEQYVFNKLCNIFFPINIKDEKIIFSYSEESSKWVIDSEKINKITNEKIIVFSNIQDNESIKEEFWKDNILITSKLNKKSITTNVSMEDIDLDFIGSEKMTEEDKW